MLSKNNSRLLTQRNAQQRQRFGLRKLTVGVASVLLGTTFFIGAASADTASTSPASPAASLTAVPSADQQPVTTGGTTLHAANNQPTVPATASPSTATPAAGTQAAVNNNVPKQAATADVTGLQFTGSVSGFKNTTAGKTATDLTFNPGDTADLTYTIRSAGDGSTAENGHWPVASRYLLTIPSGFKLSSFSTGDYTSVSLGQVGSNNEWVYLITLNQTPSYQFPVAITAHLVAVMDDIKDGGAHDYSGFPIPGLLMAVNDDNHFDSSHAVTLGGQTYQVTNCSPFLHGNSLGEAVDYTVTPGTTALAADNYQIVSVNGSVHDGTGAQVGYEELQTEIKVTGTVHSGDYIDFHLGLPYTDSQGQTQYAAYDKTLAANWTTADKSVTIYNMGDYYRMVFNVNSESLTNPDIKLDLRWGATGNQASVNAGKVYVYRPTTDTTQNRKEFDFTPTNDVTINGNRYASGLTIKGQYLSTQPTTEADAKFGASTATNPVRTWDNQGNVLVNTHWTNSFALSTDMRQSSNKFGLNIEVAKNPTLTYSWMSDDDLAQEIAKQLAPLTTHQLSDQVAGADQTYVTDTVKKGDRPVTKITVTHEDLDDVANGYHRIYHVVIADPTVSIDGPVTVLTVSADNYTLPSGITSYADDVKQSNAVNNQNAFGLSENNAVTANQQLQTALQDTYITSPQLGTGKAAAIMSVNNDTTGQYAGGFGWSEWLAQIALKPNGTVDGGAQVSDLVTTNFRIEDVNSHEQLNPGNAYQGPTGSTVSFAGAQEAYDQLQGYQFVKAVSVKDGVETVLNGFDPTQIEKYSYGTAGKDQPSEFIVYVQKAPVNVTETIHYVYGDGPQKGQPAAPDKLTTLTFTPVYDQQTKQYSYQVAGQTTGTFAVVNNPAIASYHVATAQTADGTDALDPAANQVQAQSVKATDANLVVTVTYVQDPVPTAATLGYVDDEENGKVLIPGGESTQGLPTATISFADLAQNERNLAKQHYVFKSITDASGNVLASGDFSKLDLDSLFGQFGSSARTFTVHFGHQTSPVSRTKTVTETIHYVYGDGPQKGQSAAPDKQATLTFTQSGTRDDVTNDVSYEPVAAQSFAAQPSPTITGYEPDQETVPAQLITVTTANFDQNLNIDTTVAYQANAQTATITYVDDTTGRTLATDHATGHFNDVITFATAPDAVISRYQGQHYDLVTNSFQAGTTYQADNQQNLFVVHFKHHLSPVHTEQTVSRTISYQSQAGQELYGSMKQSVTFTGTGTRDNVTGDLVEVNADGTVQKNADGTLIQGALAWQPTTGIPNFAAVPYASVPGYHVVSVTPTDQREQGNTGIKALTVTPTTESLTVTVTYARDQQATLNFVDDDNGTTIHEPLTVSGINGQPISFGDVAGIVRDLENKHYVLKNTTNDTQPATALLALQLAQSSGEQIGGSQDTDWQALFGSFDDNDAVNQVFSIHFTHGHGPLQKQHQQVVTETIHYVRANDHTAIVPDHVASLAFDGEGYHDLVTDQDIITSWHAIDSSQDQAEFAAVPNPSITGYHVIAGVDGNGNTVLSADNQGVASRSAITHATPDIVITVSYAADPVPVTPTTPTGQPGDNPTPAENSTAAVDQPGLTGTPTSHGPASSVNAVPGAATATTPAQPAQRLPQTGTHNPLALAGLGLVSLLGALGLTKRRQHEND